MPRFSIPRVVSAIARRLGFKKTTPYSVPPDTDPLSYNSVETDPAYRSSSYAQQIETDPCITPLPSFNSDPDHEARYEAQIETDPYINIVPPTNESSSNGTHRA